MSGEECVAELRTPGKYADSAACVALARTLGRSALLISVLQDGKIHLQQLHITLDDEQLYSGPDFSCMEHPLWRDSRAIVIGLDTVGLHCVGSMCSQSHA